MERIARLEQRADKVDIILRGNPDNLAEEPGLVREVDGIKKQMIPDLPLKLDRIERAVKLAVWLLASVAVPACLAAVGWLFRQVFGG